MMDDDKNKNKSGDKKDGHHWRPFKSLDGEIGEIENRLRGHRASSTLHAAAIERGLRDRMSSPTALFVAAGAGFVAGRFGVFRKRHSPEAVDGQPAENKRGGFDGAAVLSRIMDGLTLAGSIMAMLPRREPEPETPSAGAANDAMMSGTTG